MKGLFLTSFFVVAAGGASAGSFFTSTLHFHAAAAEVEAYLTEGGYAAFLVTDGKAGSPVLITEAQGDTQSEEAARDFLTKITAHFHPFAVAGQVHDSDILVVTAYDRGREVLAYDSVLGLKTVEIKAPR